MNREDLAELYRRYIACLNRQDWSQLGSHVDNHVEYNGSSIGLTGYQNMLESDYRAIPDLQFNPELLVSDPPVIACRLQFDCRPIGDLFGFPVNGRRVQFSENVFYEYSNGRIRRVWSVIDRAPFINPIIASPSPCHGTQQPAE